MSWRYPTARLIASSSYTTRKRAAPLGGRSERSTGIGANPLHHGTEAIRALRREMFAQTHAFEQFDGIGVQNLPALLPE